MNGENVVTNRSSNFQINSNDVRHDNLNSHFDWDKTTTENLNTWLIININRYGLIYSIKISAFFYFDQQIRFKSSACRHLCSATPNLFWSEKIVLSKWIRFVYSIKRSPFTCHWKSNLIRKLHELYETLAKFETRKTKQNIDEQKKMRAIKFSLKIICFVSVSRMFNKWGGEFSK